MRRFFVPPESIRDDQVVFPPAESRHVAAALRLSAGEQVVVFDGHGQEYVVELTAVDPRAVAGRILASRPSPASPVYLTLVQGIPKGTKMDVVVRMGTEVGMDRFLPVLTQRAVARPTPARVERWRRIAAAAAKQCGRATVPDVADPLPFTEAWPVPAGALVLLPWEGEKSRAIGAVLPAHRRAAAVVICIGPEGGWAPEEVDAAVAQGAMPVTLGPLTLRTETAGVVAAAMVLYELSLRPPNA